MKAGGENKLQKPQKEEMLPKGEVFAQLVENTVFIL